MPYYSLLRRQCQGEEPPAPTGPEENAESLQRYTWSKWIFWVLWDNRYWIRLMHRLPYRVVVQPYAQEYAAAFRAQLTPVERRRLEALLSHYAPAKVRYTLPALYLDEDLDLSDVRPRLDYPIPSAVPGGGYRNDKKASTSQDPVPDLDQRMTTAGGTTGKTKMKMLALPSLDVRIPGLKDWLLYEIRYKRVDRDTLESAGGFCREPFVAPPRTSKPSVRERESGEHGRTDKGMLWRDYRALPAQHQDLRI